MAVDPFDFAVFGSTPLARLVAGYLATTHGAKVVLISETDAAYRIAHGFDLSVGPVTRPETWALVAQCVPEVTRLLSRHAGRLGWSRHDPLLTARTARGRQALSHIRRMAAGYGHQAERLAASEADGDRLVIRDAVMLHRAALGGVLHKMLTESGVHHVHPSALTAIRFTDGGVEFSGPDRQRARRAVLADDAAIGKLLGARSQLLRAEGYGALIAETDTDRSAPVMIDLDTGLETVQRRPGTLAAIAPLSGYAGPERAIPAMLRGTRLRVGARALFDRYTTTDGGPVFGQVTEKGPTILAATRPFGGFIAPAIARWLVDAPAPGEHTYFSARHARRKAVPSPVGDIDLPLTTAVGHAA